MSAITSEQLERLDAIRSIDPERLVPKNKRHSLKLETVNTGAVISIHNKTYLVLSSSHYEELSWNFKRSEGYTVYELSLYCLETGEISWLEWEKDDTIVVSHSFKKLSNNPVDYGHKSWKLFLNDNRLDRNLKLSVDGTVYTYNDDESWAARYYRDDDPKSQLARMYEFTTTEGTNLTVEVWGKDGDDGVDIWLSRNIQPTSLKLIAKGET